MADGGQPLSQTVSPADLALREAGGNMQAAEAKLAQGVGDDVLGALRTCTGVLASQPQAQDVKVVEFSMSVGGTELIQNTQIDLNIVCSPCTSRALRQALSAKRRQRQLGLGRKNQEAGRRYGLVGENGCGKSNFFQCLAHREVPIPEHIDIYHLNEEAQPTDRTALQAVVDHVTEEIKKLQDMQEKILCSSGPEDPRVDAINERLDELDPATFESRAAELLHGLGFKKEMMARATKDMSGGWRMRVSLARALFAQPMMLLLDEPTNHLDLEACVWLEEYLRNYSKCLVLISHSQDFLNGVCTNIIRISQQKLTYYSGDYDTFLKTLRENEVIQAKKYEKEQEDITKLREFISACGTYANLMKQAKSKQKILDKMYAAGLTEAVVSSKTMKFSFPECGKLPPPVLPFADVSFSYSGTDNDLLYHQVNLAIDCDSRVALVGPNGAGKSTLMKLMAGELKANSGTISRHPHLTFAKFHQHSTDQLDNNCTVLDYFNDSYPNMKSIDQWRAYVGKFGFTGRMQTARIGHLSEGQKSRLVFALICLAHPNLLLLDEPTNHLDIDAIDTLADAIKAYNGGLVLVSHDFRLIDQVARDIWVCDERKVTVWKGDIRSYKAALAKKMGARGRLCCRPAAGQGTRPVRVPKWGEGVRDASAEDCSGGEKRMTSCDAASGRVEEGWGCRGNTGKGERMTRCAPAVVLAGSWSDCHVSGLVHGESGAGGNGGPRSSILPVSNAVEKRERMGWK
ncbi:hypothetical protein CYMTET_28853 [Cymbomonas tetramitiformis]|uniref:ABC transporter domain-containing protein n=1 Tax=Cymbomonas tetramitiformis TaxID=36881 RepID=A0AAE0KVT7_9CHLO|nr:hypothetical protein CYMTET_28853 [Cymbomonas tetramitiformis]